MVEREPPVGGLAAPQGTVARAALVYVERVVLTIVAFLTSLLLVRALSTQDYGLYRLVVGSLTIVTYATSVGLEPVVARFVPEFLARGEHRRVARLTAAAAATRVVALLVVFSIAYGFREQAGDLFGAPRLFDDHLLVAFAFIALTLLTTLVGQAVLVGYSLRHVITYVRLTNDIALFVLLALVVTSGRGVGGIIAAMAGVALGQLAIYLIIVTPKLARSWKLGLPGGGSDATTVGSLVSFGAYHYLWQGGLVLREFAVDSFVIAALLGTGDVALYGVAVMMPTLLRGFMPGRILAGVLLPMLVTAYSVDRSDAALVRWYQLLQKLVLVAVAPAVLVAAVFAPEILAFVYGDSYRAAGAAASIVIGSSVVLAATDPFYLTAQVLARPKIMFYSSVWGLYNLAMNLILVPVWGIEGAAIGTGSAAILQFLHFHLGFRFIMRYPLPFPWRAGRQVVFNALPLAVSLVVAAQFGLLHPVGGAIVVAGGLSYGMMSRVNGVFNDDERGFLREQLADVLRSS